MSERNLFAVITSERQIKVINLPSLVCVHKYSLQDGVIAKASVVVLNCNWKSYLMRLKYIKFMIYSFYFEALSYLSCCLTNGIFMVFNLPNLKLNLNLSLSPISRDKSFWWLCILIKWQNIFETNNSICLKWTNFENIHIRFKRTLDLHVLTIWNAKVVRVVKFKQCQFEWDAFGAVWSQNSHAHTAQIKHI